MMLRHLRKRRWLLILLALVTPIAVFGFIKWREAGIKGGQKYAKPFRIAGNLYYVGANDIASFLITGPEGHVLIDGGYPGTPPLIMASIAELGFNIRDVEVLLNSETHYDHAGGLAALQRASGAKLWASAPSADVIESGGDDPAIFFRSDSSSGSGSSDTLQRVSIIDSRTETRFASDPSRSRLISPRGTRAAAPRGRSPSATLTGC